MSTHMTNSPAAPGTATSATPVTRGASTAGYWVGAVIALLATVGAVAWGVFAFLGWQAHIEDFPRVTPPGTAAVSVTDPGTHFLYLEHDRSTATPPTPAITVTGPTGTEVPLAAYRAEVRYDVPAVADRVGDAALTFPADQPGTYRVTVAEAEQGTVVAVGDSLLWGWGPQVVGIVVLLVGGVLVGLTVVIVTAVRRAGATT